MQTAIILSHEDLLTTRQYWYEVKEAMEVRPLMTLLGIAMHDYVNQICSQLDDRIAAIDTKSDAVPALSCATLSRITKTLSGNVLVNGNPNITVSFIHNDINITQP